MGKGWTLTEMLVTLGVMGVLLALAGELTVWGLKTGSALTEQQKQRRYAMKAMEELVTWLAQAEKVTVTYDGLVFFSHDRWVQVISEDGKILVKGEGKEHPFLPEGFFASLKANWEKPSLLRLALKVKGKGKPQIWQTKVFLPLWRRWK